MISGMTAIGTLAAIAIDRYIIISRSFHGQNLTGVSASVTIALIWVYSLSQAVPPLFGWNRYVVEHPGIACSLDWQTPDVTHTSFIVYIFVLGYVLPVLIMSFCYWKVIWIIKRSPKPTGRSSTAKAEQKVTIMATMMLVCTLAAWTPYAVVSLMVSLGYDHLLGPVSSVCPAIFAKTSVVYNPIVYFFFNTQIREAILAKIPKRFKRRSTESGAEISLETKRGLTIVNTVISNHVMANCNESATTLNL
ncbi:rhodopsin-like [Argiope bruennichi]|uniref:Rhodopsin like protein n=1 Tax=Argiope bruennichi TaxID=94029 RepID=A0A8T0EM19_ARGBR|nr:rhodopsin-like [Argiope bruennichi]KAF8773575.1 Rhodopsin like protein [Argiope bruennichi]